MRERTFFGILIVVMVLVTSTVVAIRVFPRGQRPIATVSYACNDGKALIAAYFTGSSTPARGDQPPIPGGSVAVALSDGRGLKLAQTLSADGMRYANEDESFVFWSKGNGALVLENNEQKTYIGCVAVVEEPKGSGLGRVYSNGSQGFSLRLPGAATSSPESHGVDGYVVDETYRYGGLGPDRIIGGVKFIIPAVFSAGTNLGSDTYLSVEQVPQTQECSASLFLGVPTQSYEVTDAGVVYSVASTTGVAAGNRYEETVYAFPDTNPCVGVRYFVHYGLFENYPEGTIKEFDKAALLEEFDAIRRTITLAP